MYRYFENFGPHVEGTVLSSTSAGSVVPTEILSLTVTGATLSFTTYSLITVRCSGSMMTVSAGPTPTVCPKACAPASMAIALAAINARLIVPLHRLGHNHPEANVSISSAFRATRCRLHVLDIVENVLDIVQTQGHVYFD